MLFLKQISAIQDNEYEAIFEDDVGNSVLVICRVAFDDGVPFIQPNPDIFMNGQTDARAVSAAVLKFHLARSSHR